MTDQTTQAEPITYSERPIRAGVFETVKRASTVVESLIAEGFTQKQITVVCSDQSKERMFREYEHQEPAGTHAEDTLAAGSALGLTLGGFTALGIVTLGGLPIVAAGALLGVSVTGTLVGLFVSRGFEKELADFYDQAVQEGHLLVAVEDKELGNAVRLARAERVFVEAGAEPIRLHEG